MRRRRVPIRGRAHPVRRALIRAKITSQQDQGGGGGQPPPVSDFPQALLDFLGPLPDNLTSTALRILFKSRIDSRLPPYITYCDRLAPTDGLQLYANQYDRVQLCYAYAAITGDADGYYRSAADRIARRYRDHYIISSNYGPNEQYTQPETLVCHYMATSDPVSFNALYQTAKRNWPLSGRHPSTWVSGSRSTEGRQLFKHTMLAAMAHHIGCPNNLGGSAFAPVYTTWAALAEACADKIVALQLTSGLDSNGNSLAGSWVMGFTGPAGGYGAGQANWAAAHMLEGLYAVHTYVVAKQAYLDCMDLAADYMLATQWDASRNCMLYQNIVSASDPRHVIPGVTTNASGTIIRGVGDIASLTATLLYRTGHTTEADASVNTNWSTSWFPGVGTAPNEVPPPVNQQLKNLQQATRNIWKWL